jgi:mono/diheme cytochrome c family protein
VAAVVVAVTLTACGEHEFEPPDREEQVEAADRLYSPALFDSVTWASDAERLQEGNSVYAAECRKCHGPLGRGVTEYAEEHSFDVPSLVDENWAFADDLEGVRRRIFIGHAEGMPTWGVAGIDPRKIDAAAHYVLEQLRPDVLEGGAALPGQAPPPSDTTGGGG